MRNTGLFTEGPKVQDPGGQEAPGRIQRANNGEMACKDYFLKKKNSIIQYLPESGSEI